MNSKRINIIRCGYGPFCENKNIYEIDYSDESLLINSNITIEEIYKLEGIKKFKESNKKQLKGQKFDEFVHVTEILLSNYICPKCKNNNTKIIFDYSYIYEMNIEYFDYGTLDVKCNKCDFEDNFYEYQGCNATASSLINKLWNQYLENWKYWNVEIKNGDKCPKCGHLIYSLDEDEKVNFGSCVSCCSRFFCEYTSDKVYPLINFL